MTIDEAKKVFINRGFVSGLFDGDKWRESVRVISSWLEQEPKAGHWIKSNIGGAKVCSVCQAHMGLSNFNYCPNCGCRMVAPQESEDKE